MLRYPHVYTATASINFKGGSRPVLYLIHQLLLHLSSPPPLNSPPFSEACLLTVPPGRHKTFKSTPFCLRWSLPATLFLLVHLKTSSLKFNLQLSSHSGRGMALIKPSNDIHSLFQQDPTLSLSAGYVHILKPPLCRVRVIVLPTCLPFLWTPWKMKTLAS